ncbi:MAG TPA: helix-turn-helix transcriptional regulator [Actinomycetota bacterium]|nr:helix-turn-helix transcriptional regulator [Actinomycetota bacterium]
MNAPGALIRRARRWAHLSQRDLAARAGVPQSTVGRIEAGSTDPRASTLSRLLRACGFDLEAEPLLGLGVDRTQIRERLRMTPRERIENTAAAAEAVSRIRGRAQRAR